MPETTNANWLDLARARAGLGSDYQLAQALGVTRQMVSKLRADAAPIPEPIADDLGRLCGVDGAVIYASCRAARAKRTDVRRFWERVARALQCALVLCVVGVFSLLPGPAQALGRAANAALQVIHYAKSRRRGSAATARNRWCPT